MRAILPQIPRRERRPSTALLLVAAIVAAAGIAAFAGLAWADQPHPWQFGMQAPATPIKERIHHFHNALLIIVFLITVFVLGLLLVTIVRFNAKRHPVPTRTTHNPIIEILWTVVPVLILVGIAIPSFKLMYYMDEVPDAKMTIKVTGHQWYWSYEYPDQGKLTFDSNMIQDKDLKTGQERMLEVDNPLVVPVGTTIRIQVTGTDVIHSWFIPSFGVQEYAIIGRLNEAWMRVLEPGTYRGECNQICGINHAYMPIVIKAVAQADFDKWLGDAKKKFAAAPAQPTAAPDANGSGTLVAANK
jgi:cytochrome c oxidase subunit 2